VLITLITLFGDLIMPINLATNLSNSNPAGVPYLIKDTDLRAGFKVVADTTARDALHVGSRAQGMFVYSVADSTFYTLDSADTTNTGWSVLNLSGAISLGAGLTLSGSDLVIDPSTMPALAISDVTGLQTAIDGKAATGHTHVISDTTGLQTALDGKSDDAHTHIIDNVTGLQTALDGKSSVAHTHTIQNLSDTTITSVTNGELLMHNGTNWLNSTLAEAGIAGASHTHAISDVTGLQTAIDGKAAAVHTHVISDVTGLQTALDGKSSTSHVHTINGISDVTIVSATVSDILTFNGSVWINDTLSNAGVAAETHNHAISDVTGLQTALDGKAATSHLHAISDVTGLQTALDGKAATAHNHSGANITSGTVAATYLPDLSALNGVTISSAAPSGGSDGDVWFQVPA
jgi:hypothetical protein